jgi:hypothetical protein
MVDSGRALHSLAHVKEAILLHGGVVTSMNIWSDFKKSAFRSKLNSSQHQNVYNTSHPPVGDPPAANDLHAVYCFGWKDTSSWRSNDSAFAGGRLEGYLLCKNSWGTRWGLNGNFKIAYGAANILQPDYTFALHFLKHNRSKDAVKLLTGNSIRVIDPAYPGCWLFSPPRPMRLLHVARELLHARQARVAPPPASIDRSFDGTSANAASTTKTALAEQLQAAHSKLQIVEDLILSNLFYSGLGTADNISAANVTTGGREAPSRGSNSNILTALAGGSDEGSSDGDGRPRSFLICNQTAGVLQHRKFNVHITTCITIAWWNISAKYCTNYC